MSMLNRPPNSTIGTAWSGKHIIILQCNFILNQVTDVKKSLHAPTEPPHNNCAETLSRYLSIGYSLGGVYQVSPHYIEYLLIK